MTQAFGCDYRLYSLLVILELFALRFMTKLLTLNVFVHYLASLFAVGFLQRIGVAGVTSNRLTQTMFRGGFNPVKPLTDG